ncbi:hypothetical protein BB561_006168 [Smittium simulii]|uniref:ATP synthase subunit d, mitochondrial n=1 Tax=Smittium simulii TaxID=133385 RepID=A0A2T9Y617_9FUNG|nr:hypothetical protein BB561_006168 [Smittium simulii]
MSARNLVESINWATLTSALSKKAQVVKSLSSFNKKYQELDRELASLREQKTDLAFEHYRDLLKNTKIVDEMQAKYSGYKLEKLDTQKYIATLADFEKTAVASATEYSSELQTKLTDLVQTVQNIDNTRSVTQLTVEDVVNATPEILEEAQAMVNNGEFYVKGYESKFPDLSLA